MVNTRPRIGGSGALLKMSAIIGTEVSTAISNYTTVGEVLNINPSLECAEVDITSLNSGVVREYIPGHLSATLSATLHLHQATATTTHDSLDLLDVYQGRQHRGWAIVIPLQDSSQITATDETQNWIFPGFLTSYSGSITNGDEAMSVDLGIRISDSTIIDATPS
jgi:hypothetical protein